MLKKSKLICTIFLVLILFNLSMVFANTESSGLTTYCKAVIAMDADTEMVLYDKNIDGKVYPASITKIMTAILAIENLDLNKTLVATKTALSIPWDSSSVYLKVDEEMTVKELLYCLLLNSGNDAANVLAEGVSGNLTDFVKLMNAKAQMLGCTGTHFANAHGYSDNNHYTTAKDIAKIFSYCIKNKTFVDIISTKSYIVDVTNKTKEKRYLSNTNRLIQTKEDSVYARFYQYCIGGKTGYTDEAGRTLVTFAKKDDKTIIVAVFGGTDVGGKDSRYTDAINLFEYCFNNFSKVTLAKKENYSYEYVNTEKGLKYYLQLEDNLDVLANSSSNNASIASYNISINDNVINSLDMNSEITNEVVGKLTFEVISLDNQSYIIERNLILTDIQDYFMITPKTTLLPILVILLIFTVFMLFVFLVCLKHMKKSSVKVAKSRKSNRHTSKK